MQFIKIVNTLLPLIAIITTKTKYVKKAKAKHRLARRLDTTF